MNPENPPRVEIDKKRIIGALVFLIILGAISWTVVYLSRREQERELVPSSVKAAIEATEKIGAAPNVEVPTSVNPVKRMLPENNPIETANPFNKAYKNPFE